MKPSWNFKNLVGERFGYLLVVEKIDDTISSSGKNKYITYNCICDCGVIKAIKGASLTSKKTVSCGCYNKSKNKKEFGESSFNKLFRTYKRNAQKANRNFNLSVDDFKILTKGNCTYCGESPKSICSGVRSNGEYIYNGIDRVDNSIGYILSNCVSCCSTCNHSKATLTKEEFYNWIERVYNTLIEIRIYQ